MRNIICVFLLAAVASGAYADPIGRDRAASIALQFMSARHPDRQIRTGDIRKRALPGEEDSRSADAPAAYYIFNDADHGGFVIVAGDDRARTILGYSDTGHLDSGNAPVNCRAWLEGIAEEMASLDDMAPTSTNTGIVYPTTPVAPMIQTAWGQNAPYNGLCPTDHTSADGTLSATGCVPTAMSQIMYYYRYPERPSGTVSYTDNKQGTTRSIDFDSQPAFRWDDMLPAYTGSESDAEKEAVAQLMMCAGYAAQTSYSAFESVAMHRTAGEAFYKYFGYDSNVHRYERAIMSDSEWTDILLGELYAGRPVLYDGRSSYVGHTFVCDGYDGNGMFHFNWGWDGTANGYFSLSALSPQDQGTGGQSNSYTYSQAMECHIQPPGYAQNEPQRSHLLSIDKLYISKGSEYFESEEGDVVCDKTGNSGFFFYAWNIGHQDFSGSLCAAIVTADAITPIPSTSNTSDITSVGYRGVSFPMDLSAFEDGTYDIGFFYRATDDSEWHRITSTLYKPYECSLQISGNTVTYGRKTVSPHLSLLQEPVVNRLYAPGDNKLTLGLINDGDTRVEGCAGILLTPEDGTAGTDAFGERIFLTEGERADIELHIDLTGYPAGTYIMTPAYSTASTLTADNAIIIGNGKMVQVADNPQIGIQAVRYYTTDKADGTFSIDLMKTNLTPWTGYIIGKVLDQDTDTGARLSSDNLSLQTTGIISCRMSGDLKGIVARSMYNVAFFLDDEKGMSLGSALLYVTGTDETSVGRISPDQIGVSRNGNTFHVTADRNIRKATLTDMSGRTLAETCGNSRNATLSADGLTRGLYIIGISTDAGSTAYIKVFFD